MRQRFVDYIQHNPPAARYSGFGSEGFDFSKILRKGRELADKYLLLSHWGRPNPNLARIASRFSGEESRIFRKAVLSSHPVAILTPAGFAGSAVSYAIRLQSVRKGGPIKLLSAKAAWELS
jgi:hypothetical protein